MDRHENIQLKALETMSHNDLISYIEHVNSCPWRQKYHVQSVIGSINAPAAVFYDDINEKYHLFYTWLPLPDEEEQHWYHVTSKDLASFTNEGLKLKPDTLFDDKGLSSGSSVSIEGREHIFYIGRSLSRQSFKYKQLIAHMDERSRLIKHTVPLIEDYEDRFKQFKDSEVIMKNGKYIILIGAESRSENGCIAVFEADNESDFEYKGILETDLEEFGWLWEYPDYFSVDGRDILVFCPQGVDRYGNYFRNNFQSGYLVGQIDFDDYSMNHGEFKEFDAGFDFYAPKVFTDQDDRQVVIGNLSMPTTTYPTEKFHYGHCLSIPRVLNVEGEKVIQTPHPDLVNLRENEVTALGYFKQYNKRMIDFYGDAYELIVEFNDYDASEIYLNLRVGKRNETRLIYNVEERMFKLDTSFSGEYPEGVEECERHVYLDSPLNKLQIFMDVSSLEIFINDGEAVMSARIFPEEDARGVELSTETGQCYVNLVRYDLKPFESEKIIYQN